MTTDRKTTSEKQAEFDISACPAMMEEMMAGEAEGCDCAEMISKFTELEEIPEEWLDTMSQMMALCGVSLEEAKEV